MTLSCKICLEIFRNPVSLPCGHIFCSECIANTVNAIKPHSNLHPCPICRSLYNIAPINANIVPPNLRPFITPSIRKVFLDEEHGQEDLRPEGSSPGIRSHSTMASELNRLRAENLALQNNGALWRKRAEMHGAANLGLLNFARAVRDQASQIARERDGLQKLLASKNDYDQKAISSTLSSGDSLLGTSRSSESQNSGVPDSNSLLFAPIPFHVNDRLRFTPSVNHGFSSIDLEFNPKNSDLERPAKRMRDGCSKGSSSKGAVDNSGVSTRNIAFDRIVSSESETRTRC